MEENFTTADYLYYHNLKVNKNKAGEPIKWDDDSVYARCARDGLCFRCKREDNDPDHRPRHKIFGLCAECDRDLSIGMEKIERTAMLESRRIGKWFKD